MKSGDETLGDNSAEGGEGEMAGESGEGKIENEVMETREMSIRHIYRNT